MNPSMLVEAPQRAIAASVQSWLLEHPILAWVLTHPLISVGILFVGIVLFRGLLDAIARLTEHIWLGILQAPMRFIRWLMSTLTNRNKQPATISEHIVSSRQEQIATILNRLEVLKQEQNELLEEVQAMLEVEQS